MKGVAKKPAAPAPSKRRNEKKEEPEEAEFAVPESTVIIPEDQLKLTPKEMDEDITRVITANNPQTAQHTVIFNFNEKDYKAVPPGPDEHITFHVNSHGTLLHNTSEDAAEQKAYERNFKSMIEDKRRQRIMAAQEEGKELTQEELEDDTQRNQFNYTDRAAQTYNASIKTRVISTVPPESSTTSGRMTQWALYDAYLSEYDRMMYAMNMEKAAKESKGKDKGSSRRSDDPMHSPAMGKTLKILERMVNQNAEDEIYSDFKYWEDPSDGFRENLGTCLPLWKFEDARTKRKMVTAIAWNPGYPDLFAVGYGSYDFMKQGSGLIAVYSLKNVGTPEYTFSVESGVMCLDFHPQHHPLLAVGCYDGTVRVFDVRRKENKPIFTCDIRSGKHTDPCWEVKWARDDGANKDLSFYSISSDGKVANWIMTKSELKMELVMTLKLSGAASASGADGPSDTGGAATASVPSASGASAPQPSSGSASSAAAGAGAGEEDARLSGLAGGCCFAFNPFQESMFLVGTEEGKIHRCSLDYAGQYLQTFEGHHMAVYAIRWNPYHPRVFLSCSADWTVKLWDCSCTTPIMSFDLGTSVGDIAWAPYSSTVFAAVSDEGKIHVWDLYANKHEQLCTQKIVKKAKCTHVAFSARAPLVLVGDSHGGVTSMKLSPNLRQVTPIPVPIQKKGEAPLPLPPRIEVEIRKLDKLLAASDAKIQIVTPIPGAGAKKEVAAAGAEGDKAEGGDDE